MVLTMDAPSEQEIGSYYQSEDYISHSDTQKNLINKLYHLVRAWMLTRKRKLIRQLHPAPGRLLDFGSGTGYFMHAMIKKGWEVTGMEPDPDARAISQKRFGLQLNAPDIDAIGNEAYDVISLWHVLEHLHNPGESLEAFKRGLKKDGTLVLALPNVESLDANHYGEYWDAYDVPRHLWHFSPRTIEQLLWQHGFEVVQSYLMPFDVFYIALRSEKHRNSNFQMVIATFKAIYWTIRSFLDKRKSSALVYLVKEKPVIQTRGN